MNFKFTFKNFKKEISPFANFFRIVRLLESYNPALTKCQAVISCSFLKFDQWLFLSHFLNCPLENPILFDCQKKQLRGGRKKILSTHNFSCNICNKWTIPPYFWIMACSFIREFSVRPLIRGVLKVRLGQNEYMKSFWLNLTFKCEATQLCYTFLIHSYKYQRDQTSLNASWNCGHQMRKKVLWNLL